MYMQRQCHFFVVCFFGGVAIAQFEGPPQRLLPTTSTNHGGRQEKSRKLQTQVGRYHGYDVLSLHTT